MSALRPIQLISIKGLRRRFKAAANTHGPLRCVLIHKEGEDRGLKLNPPSCEAMPSGASTRQSVYGDPVNCLRPNGEGTFAVRDIYVLRNRKQMVAVMPLDPNNLLIDPDWPRLSQRTGESWATFEPLAAEAGKCFDADDFGMLPGVARESLESHEDDARWLWIVFDLAWQKVRDSPLRADRWVWHETEGQCGQFFAWGMDFAELWEREYKARAGRVKSGPANPFSFVKAWAKRPPGYYYSSLDDLFTASVQAIDLLTIGKADSSVKQPSRRTGRRHGRRPVSAEEEERRRGILSRWERVRGAGVSRAKFCTDEMIAVKDLENFQRWLQQRVSRGA